MNAAGRQFNNSIRTVRVEPSEPSRSERDSLGELQVPASAYWGINTARALENFAISGRPIAEFPDLIVAYAQVKQAAARANAEIGSLSAERAALIDAACEEIASGALLEQFVVDTVQCGAGTSTNMNVNEVIANRALELAGRAKGDYDHISPNDHVNRSQSTNDTYPTALKLALHAALQRLLDEIDQLAKAFAAKAREFAGTLKVGRTQLQDAVPMTLEQEFAAFAASLGDARDALGQLAPMLRTTSLGATAVGTGIAADPAYAGAAHRHLTGITGLELRLADDLVAATSDSSVYVQFSGTLKRFAVQLSKICNDLRLLSSGPQAGLGDIKLPERQAGSSIMPGKVNPVICEVVNEVAFVVLGADVVVSLAAEAGQLQLNAFGPVIALSLLMSEKWLTAALITLREHCVEGIVANYEQLRERASSFAGIVTAFTPFIGYQAAARIAKQALATGQDVGGLIVQAGLMERVDVATLLEPARLSGAERTPPNMTREYAQDRTTRE